MLKFLERTRTWKSLKEHSLEKFRSNLEKRWDLQMPISLKIMSLSNPVIEAFTLRIAQNETAI